jgi:TRAP-type C4-dicarboxylate transport system substrate-binding protein
MLGRANRKKAAMNARIPPSRAWVVLIAALALGAAACSSGSLDKAGGPVSRPVVLTLADGEGDISNAQPFADAVSSLSHGSLQIKIEGPWRPNDASYSADLIKDVQAGKAQLGVTASRAFDTVGISSFQALQAPFLIDNYPLERKVLDSAIPGEMLAGLSPHGLVGLAVLPGPLWRPFGFTRPLVAASSYRGARIAIGPSAVGAGIFRALGAIPVTTKRSNSVPVIAGLTGIENSASTIDAGFATPGAILTGNVVFEPRPYVLFINQHAFGSLTASQRDILYRAAAQARAAGIYQGNDTASAADLCRRGIKIVSASPADLAGLRAAVQPVYHMLEANPSTSAFIAQITSMRAAVSAPPDSVTCPAAGTAGQSTAALTQLEGTWEVTYTQGELLAAGADPGGIGNPANYGHFTIKFNQGQWWMTGPPGTNGNASGTYAVTGNQITFNRHDNAYPSSDTEIWGPYTWSVYRDTLTFKKAGWTGDTQGPTGLVVKPWRKTGT